MKWKLVIFSCILFNFSHNSFAQKLSWEFDLGVEKFQYGEIYKYKSYIGNKIHELILPYSGTGVTYRNKYFATGISVSVFEVGHAIYSFKGRLGLNALFYAKKKPMYLGPFVDLCFINPSSENFLDENSPLEVKYIGGIGVELITNRLKFSVSAGLFFRYENNEFVSNYNTRRVNGQNGFIYDFYDGFTYYMRFSVAYQLRLWEKRKVDL